MRRSEPAPGGPGAPGSPRGSLRPREHGAYAQVAFPLLTGLVLGGRGGIRGAGAALLLSAAVVSFFLLHEPLLVAIGARGNRLREALGRRARRRVALLLGAGMGAGAAGLGLAPDPAVRPAVLVPVVLALLLLPLVLTRRERTLPGELLVGFALASATLPVAVAAGVPPATGGAAAGAWGLVFALAVFTVRELIARGKGRPVASLSPILSGGTLGAALLLLLVPGGTVPPAVALAPAPQAVACLSLALLGVPPRRLRVVGWTLVASNAATFLILAVGLR